MKNEVKRCWDTSNPLHILYHDKEWGVPLHDDEKLFEFLVLGSFQAGLSWWLILQKRDKFREAFDCFNPKKVSKYNQSDIECLLKKSGIVRNRAKIETAINNAKRVLETQKEFGSFDAFIWKFVNGKTINNSFSSLSSLPAETELSRTLSCELKKRGFKFVGPTICYAFMQAIGMVNDHLVDCFRHSEIRDTSQTSVLSGYHNKRRSNSESSSL